MTAPSQSPPGWYPDPSGRHLHRWWDGAVWTDRVGDGSVEQHDPIGSTPQPHAEPSGPAAIWDSLPAKRSTPGWLIALIVAGTAVGLLVVVAVIGLVVLAGTSETIIDESFDSGTGPFSTDSDNFVDLEFADGGYRVTVKDARSPQEARSFFEPARDAVRVESDVSIVDSSGGSAAGLSCYAGSASGYLFVVSNDGSWGIVKVIDAQTGELDPLEEGSSGVSLGTTSHRLRLDCTGGGTTPTKLTGSIDGTEIATASDDQGFDQFRAAGYWVGGEQAPIVVLFDDFLVTEP